MARKRLLLSKSFKSREPLQGPEGARRGIESMKALLLDELGDLRPELEVTFTYAYYVRELQPAKTLKKNTTV
jgi:hypothetical protein